MILGTIRRFVATGQMVLMLGCAPARLSVISRPRLS